MKTINAQKATALLRDYALSFPEAHEDFPWGERVIKVKKKVFVFMGHTSEKGLSVCAKLPNTGEVARTLPFATPAGYGLAKAGWVVAQFEPKANVPVSLLQEWIRESYCAVAPKKLVVQLEQPLTPRRSKR